MLNYNQALSEKKTFQDLHMEEIKPIMKLIYKQIMVNLYGKNVWKQEKSLVLHLMGLKLCNY